MSNEYVYTNDNKFFDKINKRKFNILIVDDDKNIANFLMDILTDRGHNVRVVNDGISCISECTNDEKKYDIIFLDYYMDDLDGLQVAEIVNDKNKKTLLFAYTGDNRETTVKKFRENNLNGIIVKPVDVKDINILMTNLENYNSIDKKIISSISTKTKKSVIIFNEIDVF